MSAETKVHQIGRDYHPIPHQYSDPDQVAAPLVIPAQLDKIRFDPSNAHQCTYVDCRGRMRAELMKVVGTNFWESVVAGDADLYNSKSAAPREKMPPLHQRFNTGSVKCSLGAGAKQAKKILMDAYLASECVAALASRFHGRYSKAWKEANAQTEPTTQSGAAAAPVPCPENLIWACSYTPNGINNNATNHETSISSNGPRQKPTATGITAPPLKALPKDHSGSAGYWAIEAGLCHYNMFALSLQMTFLQMHTERPNAYLPGKGNEGRRRILAGLSCANGCMAHLNRILAHWSPMRFDDLERFGVVPDRAYFEGVYVHLVNLLRLQYYIFHVILPVHHDTDDIAMYDSVVREFSFERQVRGLHSDSPATTASPPLTPDAANNKERVWSYYVVSVLAVALKRAQHLHSAVFTHSVYEHPIGGKRFYDEKPFRRRLSLNHIYSAFFVKYVTQSVCVFSLLYRTLRARIALDNDGVPPNQPTPLLAESQLSILKSVHSLYANDDEFLLCMDSVAKGYDDDGDDPADDTVRRLDDAHKYRDGLRHSIYDERQRILDYVPTGKRYISPHIPTSEINKLNVALPGEIYLCDFAFNVWEMQTFAQFPLSLITTAREIMTGAQDLFALLESKIAAEHADGRILSELLQESSDSDGEGDGDGGDGEENAAALAAAAASATNQNEANMALMRTQVRDALDIQNLQAKIKQREVWYEREFVKADGGGLSYVPSRLCREFLDSLN